MLIPSSETGAFTLLCSRFSQSVWHVSTCNLTILYLHTGAFLRGALYIVNATLVRNIFTSRQNAHAILLHWIGIKMDMKETRALFSTPPLWRQQHTNEPAGTALCGVCCCAVPIKAQMEQKKLIFQTAQPPVKLSTSAYNLICNYPFAP